MSVHIRGRPLSAFPLAIVILGSLLFILRVAASHYVQNQPQGALLSKTPQRNSAKKTWKHEENVVKVTVPEPRETFSYLRLTQGLVAKDWAAKILQIILKNVFLHVRKVAKRQQKEETLGRNFTKNVI